MAMVEDTQIPSVRNYRIGFGKWEENVFAFFFVLVALPILIVGFLISNNYWGSSTVIIQIARDLYANIGAELISIAITVLIVDRLAENRSKRQRRAELISELGGEFIGNTMRALRLVKHYGYDTDGSLEHAHLWGANLQAGNLEGVYLCHAALGHANLQGANLRGADLEKAMLANTNLKAAWLLSANLREAELVSVNLQDANLEGADLQKAILGHANLQGANLSHANLEGTNLGVANLRNANLEYTQLNRDTIMPDGRQWTELVDLAMFTNPDHPHFWQPEWLNDAQEATPQ